MSYLRKSKNRIKELFSEIIIEKVKSNTYAKI